METPREERTFPKPQTSTVAVALLGQWDQCQMQEFVFKCGGFMVPLYSCMGVCGPWLQHPAVST